MKLKVLIKNLAWIFLIWLFGSALIVCFLTIGNFATALSNAVIPDFEIVILLLLFTFGPFLIGVLVLTMMTSTGVFDKPSSNAHTEELKE